MYPADGHDAPVRSFLFADGLAYGPSDLDGLFDRLDAPYAAGSDRFLEQLLSSGVDVILIGFDKRHDYVHVNAGVVQECIHRAQRAGFPLLRPRGHLLTAADAAPARTTCDGRLPAPADQARRRQRAR
ncbi:hypothetical protein ABIA39_001477 [Nocardia sp. GAS34]|uniref:hypothetical protein n=1 Tax=unclassified Nocardia TaxID=2637762 RepID=UPI003D1B23FA